MTQKRKADHREPCPPVAVTPEVVIRAAGPPVRTVREPDSYDAPTRRKRVAPDGEIKTTVIDLAARHIAPLALRPDPYHLDDDG